MPISNFTLLLVLSAAWMGNGMPAEPKQPTSRDSRQMMFPMGAVPMQQPGNFFDYGALVHQLHPAVKYRLLDALLTATTAMAENPALYPDYKTGTQPDNFNSSTLDPNASDEELFQRVSHLLPYSLGELKEMEARLGLDTVITIIVQALLGQLVNIVLVPFIISIITGLLAG